MTDISQPGILVIDDERGPRESLRILLNRKYRVFCAENVMQGLSLLREKAPDLVIMDIRMPGVDGIEGLRLSREIDPEVGVIILTGYGSLETAQKALRLGACDYLKKPFETDELLRLIARHIEQRLIARKRVEKERELHELNERLLDDIKRRNHLASLGQASAELVHDLRNPMTVVYGYVQLLSRDLRKTMNDAPGSSSNLKALEYLDVVEKGVERCTDLIDVWQSLGRKNPESVTTINPSDMLAQVAGEMKETAAERGAHIAIRNHDKSCRILGDPVQLARVIQNLLGNAIESLTPDGTGRIWIGCREADGYVRITVEDNGCGISPDVQKHMLKAFVTTKRRHHGLGLGLFITRKIIDDHNGRLKFTSEIDVGSRFTVELPSLTKAARSE